jgi:hypothetical protein
LALQTSWFCYSAVVEDCRAHASTDLSRLNPPEMWIRQPVPELRILDDALWEAVQARLARSAPARPLRRRGRIGSGSGAAPSTC